MGIPTAAMLAFAASIFCGVMHAQSAPVLAAPDSSAGDISLSGIDPAFTGSVTLGGNLAVSFTGTDSDALDTLTTTITVTGGTITPQQAGFTESFPYSPSGSPSPHTVSLTGTAAQQGLVVFTVTVSDGLLVDLYTLSVSILGTNAAPLLSAPVSEGDIQIIGASPVFIATADIGDSLGVSFTATDANATDSLTTTITLIGGTITESQAGFSQSMPSSPAPSASPHTVSLSGTALNPGLVVLQVAVSDGQGGLAQYTVELTILSAAGPNLQLNGVLVPFTSPGVGQPSAEQSYTCSGVGLTSDVTITPPAHFQVSLTSGSGFTSSAVVLPATGGVLSATPVYVRYLPTSAGPHAGLITHVAVAVTTIDLPVSGLIVGSTNVDLQPAVNVSREAGPGWSLPCLKIRLQENTGATDQLLDTVVLDIHALNGWTWGTQWVVSAAIVIDGVTAGIVTNGTADWQESPGVAAVTFRNLNHVISSGSTAEVDFHIFLSGNTPVSSPALTLQATLDPNDINGGGAGGLLFTGEPVVVPDLDDPLNDDGNSSCTVSGSTSAPGVLLLLIAVLAVGFRTLRGHTWD